MRKMLKKVFKNMVSYYTRIYVCIHMTRNHQILIFFNILFCTIQTFSTNHITFIISHNIAALYSPKQKLYRYKDYRRFY